MILCAVSKHLSIYLQNMQTDTLIAGIIPVLIMFVNFIFFLQQFATENFLVERDRQGIDGKGIEDIWPLVLMMDDSCVMWQNLLK